METASGLTALWTQGDGVTRAVALLLLGMSLASWTIVALKGLDLLQHRRSAARVEAFWRSPGFAAALAHWEQGGADPARNPFHRLATQGQQALEHLQCARTSGQPSLQQGLDLSDWVTRALRNALDDSTAALQSGLAVLASVGSTAPFVGLFGTVWGIYHALMGIGAAGQATIDKVAGPIGEALIMTALGLAVAIPAVLAYNALVRANKRIQHQLQRFAHDLHAYLVTGARVAAPGAGVAAPLSVPELRRA